MTHSGRRLALLLCGVVVGCLPASQGAAQAVPGNARRIQDPAIQGGQVFRLGKSLFVVPDQVTEPGSLTIPRFCGSLRAMGWAGQSDGPAVVVRPEPGEWTVEWQNTPAGVNTVVLEFDQEPKLPSELEPAAPAGDGSIMLHAYQGRTRGEKLRYEPQPFKNTVGYWTVPTDSVSWKLRIDEAGQYNVGILQGCGAGQGGSRASLHLQKGDSQPLGTLKFDVLETGHFQNFQWRHLGTLTVAEPGVYSLEIAPTEIKHAALMDVRAIHLVRLPPKQKS